MKATKYVLAAASIVAVLVTIAWFLRDNLIQRISNPLLDDYGISVTDVSLDALAAGDASIGYLELVHDKGTTIAIEDLTLPFGTTPKETKIYTAKKVTIVTATRADGELFELAQLINQFISLPDNLDDSEVAVGEFSLPPYPPVYDLRWELTDGEQRLRGSIDSILMSLMITRTDARNHNVVFSLAGGSAPLPGHSVAANLQQGDHGILIGGTSSIDLPTWGPVAKLSGVVLPEIEINSGTATFQFDVEIPDDATRSPTLASNFAPTEPLQITYAGKSDDITSIHVESASPVEFAATFPNVDWSLQQAQASLRVNYGEWQDIPLSVSNLSCQSGPACSMETQVAMDTTELPIGKAGRLEFVSAENVLFPDAGVRINVRPGAAFKLKGLALSETNVDGIEAQLVSAASLELLDAGWQLAAGSLDAKIQSISVSDDVSVTASLFLENVLVSELDDILSARSVVFAPSSQATVSERVITLPGFKGDVFLLGTNAAIDLETVGLYRNGTVKAAHSLETGAGRLDIVGASVSFGARTLSNRVSPWQDDVDLVAGTVSVELGARWGQKNAGVEFDGHTSVSISDLAGYYTDTVFSGLSTELNIAYNSATEFTADPSTVTIALIEMGLPVENLIAEYTLEPGEMSIGVESLQMAAFGGVISADPFSFRTETDSNTLTLHAESLELTELLSLGESEAIEVSGRIGATLPVTIEDNTVTIVNGVLTGEPSGGVIRYRPGRPPDESDASSIGLVTRALSNFEFKTLTSDVSLSRDGDLNLKLQLTGRNPDLDEKRPVVLNLGVENNIPQMLKSLRAARAVEEILEQRLNE